MGYIVLRNAQRYGPYTIDILSQYVTIGQVLKCDSAYEENNPSHVESVGYFLKKEGKNVKVRAKGGLISQLKDIGQELILPQSLFNRQLWASDKRVLVLSIIGLTPLLLLPLIRSIDVQVVTFYAISLYFATIWGVFFYYLFKTPQVTLKRTLSIFFITQVFILFFFGFGGHNINVFYALKNSSGVLGRIVFYVFAVGITEELSKQIPIHLTVRQTREPLIPQTLVFYGLMSGIAFGVLEGVEYQLGINSELGYGAAFFMNIARLTSLPFLHAIWCGIGAYFISFAHLYPRYQISLYFLSVCIPALLHGIYDAMGYFISLPTTMTSVILLMVYLKQGVNMQSKLRQ